MEEPILDDTTKELLSAVTDSKIEKASDILGAYNIRLNSCAVARQSSDDVTIQTSSEGHLEIIVKPNAKYCKVYIPACVTKSKITDVAYNDFFIGENASVTIVAGCGIHTDDGHETAHNGIHRFFLKPNSSVVYLEKHLGTGTQQSKRHINPVTEVFQEENSYIEMNTSQIGGVDYSDRTTKAVLGKKAKLVIKENLLTEKEQTLKTNFYLELNGEDCSANLVSRSVAKGNSTQEYHSNIIGNAKSFGHSECDAILVDSGKVVAIPELTAANQEASLIHEAAIGKIAGEQILKLQTLGFSEEEAEQKIIEGFLEG